MKYLDARLCPVWFNLVTAIADMAIAYRIWNGGLSRPNVVSFAICCAHALANITWAITK